MKKLILSVLLIVGFLFSQNLPPQSDIEKMTASEKMMLYNMNKKSPALGVTYSFLLSTSGHAYAGNWKKGMKFFGAQLGALSMFLIFNNLSFQNQYCEKGEIREIDEYGDGLCFNVEENEYYSFASGYRYSNLDPVYLSTSIVALALIPIISIWEKIDAGKEVKKYNRILYKSIYGEYPSSFSLNLQPTYQGANLTLSYSLN